MQTVQSQQQAFEIIYKPETASRFDFHVTTDPLTRYLRDRRLGVALDYLRSKYPTRELLQWSVLLVCGGVGGEGIFFLKMGFADVTVSDISSNSLKIANMLSPSLKTVLLNAEEMDLKDASYDLVIVQDGLHHLPRPVLGFTEMLRVASKGVIVIEPYDSLVGNQFGTEWETEGDFVNFVFRWNRKILTQVTKSYLLKNYRSIKVFRLWDHNVVIRKMVKKFPLAFQLRMSKILYGIMSLFNPLGNMMVAVVLK
jgi:ubiquinone/menaquinone biosynthesis C-methylase UbiE